jgi:hypothetical protein
MLAAFFYLYVFLALDAVVFHLSTPFLRHHLRKSSESLHYVLRCVPVPLRTTFSDLIFEKRQVLLWNVISDLTETVARYKIPEKRPTFVVWSPVSAVRMSETQVDEEQTAMLVKFVERVISVGQVAVDYFEGFF